MSCEDCLSRREFLARGTLAVAGAAALAAGCGDGQFGPVALPASSKLLSLKVGAVPGLETSGKLVQVLRELEPIVVKRTGTATFLAFSAICTHQGCATGIQGSIIVCPCHGTRYDSDGHVTRQPDFGSATNLPVYSTKYDAATDTLTIG